MHLQHMGPKGGMSPPTQGLWNENGGIQHRSNAYSDSMHDGESHVQSHPYARIQKSEFFIFFVEREDGNSGNSQAPSSSSVIMYPVTVPHRGMSHAQTAPAPFDWRHQLSPQPDHDVPPVPPLPPLFQMPRVGPSSQTTSVFLTPTTSLVGRSQRPSPPRSPLCEQVSIAEVTPEPGIEVFPVAEPGQTPQLEEPMQQTRLLPDSVFTDPDGELESAAVESRRSSTLFTPTHRPPTPPTDVMGKGRTDAMDLVHHAAAPSAP